MFGRLKSFLESGLAVPADELQRAVDELHIELMALPVISRDFSTPEGAILCLEDAYRRRDIEAAVAAKDFKTEARFLLAKAKFRIYIDDESVAKTAEVLELAFRAHTSAQWPDFDSLESFFPEREELEHRVVAVTEVCRFPDGLFSRQKMFVVETADGWKVFHSD